jgi:hypothetical protein
VLGYISIVRNSGSSVSQCEELWVQNVPVSGAVDPVCPNVRNGGPSMPQCEEMWAQYVPWRGDNDQLPEPVGAVGMSAGWERTVQRSDS